MACSVTSRIQIAWPRQAFASTESGPIGICCGSSASIFVTAGTPQRSRTVSEVVLGICARCAPPDQLIMRDTAMMIAATTRSGSFCSRMMVAISFSSCSSNCCCVSRVTLRPTPR